MKCPTVCEGQGGPIRRFIGERLFLAVVLLQLIACHSRRLVVYGGDSPDDFKIVEVERKPKTSLLRRTGVHSSAFVDSLETAAALLKVAKARGDKYFITLKEWDGNDGSWFYLVGFTKSKDTDLKKWFGHDFTEKDESGQKCFLWPVDVKERNNLFQECLPK